MPRALPEHPSLEYLKKQAKDRLRDLRRRQPASKLAAAQHEVAREYGFASWPKLKAHVESLAQPAVPDSALVAVQAESGGARGGGGTTVNASDSLPSYGFGRYSQAARQALFFSRYEASELGSGSIEIEHVLLGLIRADQGLTGRILREARVALERTRTEVGARLGARERLPPGVVVPFSPATKRILRHAVEEADRGRHHHIGTTDLLVGILCEEESVAASILRQKGMRLGAVRDDILRLPNEEMM
jgi:hypothetical protein